MKNIFIASLIKSGVLGGAVYVEDDALTFRTNKLTVSEAYRRLRLPFSEIQAISPGQCWPLVEITMKNGQVYRFLIFARKRFSQRVAPSL